MEVVAALLGLVAVILLFLLVTTRRRATSAASSAALTQQALQSDLTAAQRARARTADELEALKKKAATEAEQAAADLQAARSEREQATERAVAAETRQREQQETIGSLERYGVELKSEIAAAQEQATTATAAAEAAALDLEAVRAEADQLRQAAGPATDGASTSGIDPELLWALEMTRSERTWRHSVAVDPDAPSPFPDAPDPLRFAVEVEAAALREEVGAFVHLQWDAEAVADPVRRLLILRIANELLAAAAREPQPFEMIAPGSDKIVLLVRSTEEGDRQINLQPPRFGTDVISFTSSDEGISVTIG